MCFHAKIGGFVSSIFMPLSHCFNKDKAVFYLKSLMLQLQ